MTAETKKCSRCHELRPLGEFWKNNQQKSGLQPHCKACHRAAQSKWSNSKNSYERARYIHKKEHHLLRIKQRRKENKELIESLKDAPCVDCGNKFPACAMDFHHLDPLEKTKGIGAMVGWSKEKILKEISKCILLCSNCHRVRHRASMITLP